MKKKTNLFLQIKQFFVEDGPDLKWWVDEFDWEDFKLNCPDLFENGNNPVTKERTVSGKQWNEWIIGSVFGDYEGHVVDEECPECGHLLVAPNEAEEEFNGRLPRYCSDCDYRNQDLIQIDDEEKAEWERIRNAPPEPKFTIPGQSLEDFCNQYGFNFSECQTMDCVICKKVVPPSEFYRTKKMAIIAYEHKETGCVNGPAKIIPQGDEQKQWKGLLGMFDEQK